MTIIAERELFLMKLPPKNKNPKKYWSKNHISGMKHLQFAILTSGPHNIFNPKSDTLPVRIFSAYFVG